MSRLLLAPTIKKIKGNIILFKKYLCLHENNKTVCVFYSEMQFECCLDIGFLKIETLKCYKMECYHPFSCKFCFCCVFFFLETFQKLNLVLFVAKPEPDSQKVESSRI